MKGQAYREMVLVVYKHIQAFVKRECL